MSDLVSLIELDRKWRLEDWWEGVLAGCAERARRRRQSYSARSLKAAATIRANRKEGDPLMREVRS